MKRTLFSIAAAIGFAIAPASALFAQSSGTVYNIPFAFNAEGQQLQAGKYVVSSNQQAGSLSGRNGGVMFISRKDLESKPTQAHLTFVKYGETYVLREVWNADGIGSKINPTSREREMMRAEQAKNAPQTVQLVATR